MPSSHRSSSSTHSYKRPFWRTAAVSLSKETASTGLSFVLAGAELAPTSESEAEAKLTLNLGVPVRKSYSLEELDAKEEDFDDGEETISSPGTSPNRTEPLVSPVLLPLPPSPLPTKPLPSTSPRPTSSNPSARTCFDPIDDIVPSLSLSPLPSPITPALVTVTSPTGLGEGHATARLSSLNPSTSRFSLSIPLLGRPKVPLDRGMMDDMKTVPPSVLQQPETPASLTSDTGAQPSATPLSAPTPSSINVTSTSSTTAAAASTTLDAAEQTPTPISTPEVTIALASDPPPLTDTTPDPTTSESNSDPPPTLEPSTSWWSYVSWGSSTSLPRSTSNPPAEAAGAQTSTDPAKQPQRSRDPSPAPSIRISPPEPDSRAVAEAPSTDVDLTSTPNDPSLTPDPSPAPIDGLPAPSLSESDPAPTTTDSTTVDDALPPVPPVVTSSSSSGSAWYTPWAWYSSSTSIDAVTDKTPAETQTSAQPDEEQPIAPEIEAPAVVEISTDEQDKAAEAPASQAPPTVESSLPSLDPIQASLSHSSIRSGWASFFSSRSLVVKRITAAPVQEDGGVERDENGVEVMDVPDFDESGEVKEEDQGKDAGKEENESRGRSEAVGTITVGKSSSTGKAPSKDKSQSQSKERGREPDTTKKPTAPSSSSRSSSIARSQTQTQTPGKGKAPPLIIADSIKFALPPTPNPTPSTSPSPTPAPISSSSKLSSQNPPPSPSTKSQSTTKALPKSKPGSGSTTPVRPPKPNLILPTWADTFHSAPRNVVPSSYLPRTSGSGPGESGSGGGGGFSLARTMKFVSGVLFAGDSPTSTSGSGGPGGKDPSATTIPATGLTTQEAKDRERQDHERKMQQERAERYRSFGPELPRAYDIVEPPAPSPSVPALVPKKSKSKKGKEREKELGGENEKGEKDTMKDVLRGCRRVLVIGIHGWFPGAVMRSVIGEPTGTSGKFVNMTVQALEEFQEANGVKLDKITKVPLEGEGTIEGRIAKLYANLKANQEWMDDLHAADAIIVATHSQGSIVSTHLLDRLIKDGHIRTARATGAMPAASVANTVLGTAENAFRTAEAFPLPLPGTPLRETLGTRKSQRVCCLALCGIHLGPLRYLSSSSLLQPYFQYFESAAARELFEFQNTESEVSKNYVNALRSVVDHGTKMVYVASLNDQVVPIYSGLFTAVSHPLILRALYIDGDAYHSSDFLSNLLVLLLRILNSGIPDSGLTMHLSEATAGSLNGVGHSTAYEEISTYSLAVKYLFLTNDGLEDQYPDLVLEPFNAATETNDYEIPWSLRDVIADERVTHFFSKEIAELKDVFRDWHPKTTILRDLKRKLQPIQRLPSTFHSFSSSKL